MIDSTLSIRAARPDDAPAALGVLHAAHTWNLANGFNFGTSLMLGNKSGETVQAYGWQGSKAAPIIVGSSKTDSTNTDASKLAVAQALSTDFTIGVLASKAVNIPGIGDVKPAGLISMLKADANTRVLSSPHLLTSNNEVAKIVVIFACVMVFITSGFDHVVANMTTFSFGLLGGLPEATVGEFARNVLFVGLGNLVGGGLLVGAANVVAASPAVPATPADAEAAEDAPARETVAAH